MHRDRGDCDKISSSSAANKIMPCSTPLNEAQPPRALFLSALNLSPSLAMESSGSCCSLGAVVQGRPVLIILLDRPLSGPAALSPSLSLSSFCFFCCCSFLFFFFCFLCSGLHAMHYEPDRSTHVRTLLARRVFPSRRAHAPPSGRRTPTDVSSRLLRGRGAMQSSIPHIPQDPTLDLPAIRRGDFFLPPRPIGQVDGRTLHPSILVSSRLLSRLREPPAVALRFCSACDRIRIFSAGGESTTCARSSHAPVSSLPPNRTFGPRNWDAKVQFRIFDLLRLSTTTLNRTYN